MYVQYALLCYQKLSDTRTSFGVAAGRLSASARPAMNVFRALLCLGKQKRPDTDVHFLVRGLPGSRGRGGSGLPGVAEIMHRPPGLIHLHRRNAATNVAKLIASSHTRKAKLFLDGLRTVVSLISALVPERLGLGQRAPAAAQLYWDVKDMGKFLAAGQEMQMLSAKENNCIYFGFTKCSETKVPSCCKPECPAASPAGGTPAGEVLHSSRRVDGSIIVRV